MALQAWDKRLREDLKIKQLENEQLAQQYELLKQQLMISADPLPHPSEDDRQTPNPNQKPSSPYLPGKSPHRLAGLQINPNSIMLPFVPKAPETDEDYGEGAVPGHPDWKMAHGEGRGPQPLYHDEYNRPLDMPPWIQMFPDGKLREIPWMKEKYLNEHPELASGPDYIGDKLRYGQLDRILNPFNDFRKPTLDQLRIHSKAYPKA